MMANRLLELHRVLKPTGSLYLHCDPTASHYLKMVLDAVFSGANFQNELVWKRTSARSDSHRWNQIHDTIFFYTKSSRFTWNTQYTDYDPAYLEKFYRFIEPETGRRYASDNLTAAGTREGSSGQPWRGISVKAKGIHWKYKIETLEKLDKEGRILWPDKSAGVPRYKRYLDEMPGVAIQSVITDISPLSAQSAEKLGYPTQKPLALLERIIAASTNEGDVVLDPFCGCGTAIHGAEKLKRRWIGIDITNLAISLVEDRLRAAFPAITFDVHGVPKDLESARDLAQRDKYEFEWWACSLVKAQPYKEKKKGADGGIDGVIYFQDDKTMPKKVIVSVKAGEHVSVPMIRDLGHVVNREKAAIGVFVTLTKPTAPMRQEAVKAGYYESPTGANFPKIQILTIEGLLEGIERLRYPDLMQGGLMSRKAKREVDAIQLGFDSAAYLSPVQTTEEPSRKDARVARAAKPRKTSRKTA